MNQNYVLKDKYLALDFDGVIANTIEECLVVGFNAYAEYRDKDHLSIISPKKAVRRRSIVDF